MKNLRNTLVLATALLLLGAGAALAVSLKGTVVSADDGRPVARALVVFEQSGKEVARTSATTDGQFFVNGLAEGTYTVKVSRGSAKKTFRGTKVRKDQPSLRFEL